MNKQLKLFVLMCLLGFTQSLKAQYVDYEFPLLPADSFTNQDSGSIIILDSSFSQYSCYIPDVRANAVAYYSTGPIAYVRIGNDIPSGTLFYLRSSSGSRTLITPSGNDLITSSLLLDSIYHLETHNTCGDTLLSAVIDTRRIANYGAVVVSPELFDSIAVFSIAMNTSITLFQYVKDLTGLIHPIEKISYLQSHFQDSLITLPSTFISGWIIPSDSYFNKRPICNCKFVIKMPMSQPASPALATNGQLWGESRTDDTAFNPGTNYRKDFWYHEQMQGPSRYMATNYKGTGGYSYNTFLQGGEADGSTTDNTPYSAQLAYNYACANNAMEVSICGCDRLLDVEYFYRSDMKAFASTKTCKVCTSERYATSQIEDAIIITAAHARTDRKEILGAGMMQAYSQSGHSINKEFLHDMVDILGDGFLIGFQWYNMIITPGLIDSTQTLLDSLIEIDRPILDSTINLSPVTMNRSGNKFVVLKANDPVKIQMAALSKTVQGGEKSFNTTTELISAFRLSAVHLSGAATNNPDCCGPVCGSWVLSTQQGKSVISYANLMGQANDHLDIWPDWWSTPNIGVDYGFLCGKTDPTCTTTVERTQNDPKNNDGLGLNINNESLILEYNQENLDSLIDNSSTYTIYDVSGKVLVAGNIGSEGFLCNTANITEQVLFIELNTLKGIQRFKLYIVNK